MGIIFYVMVLSKFRLIGHCATMADSSMSYNEWIHLVESNTDKNFILLSVQCNTLHGIDYKITCGVCLCVYTHIWGRISQKRLEIEVRFQWDTNRK